MAAGEVAASAADETAAVVRFGDDGDDDIGEEAEPRRWREGRGDDDLGDIICGDGEEESSPRPRRGGCGGGDGEEPLSSEEPAPAIRLWWCWAARWLKRWWCWLRLARSERMFLLPDEER